jgi:AraC-like DNA-binding protein
MLKHQFYPPSSRFIQYIMGYIFIENDFRGLSISPVINVYPTGLHGIVISYGQPYLYMNVHGVNTTFDQGMALVGAHEKLFQLVPQQQQKQILILFQLGVLSRVLKTSLIHFKNHVVDLKDLRYDEEQLPLKLANCTQKETLLKEVETWLQKILAPLQPFNSLSREIIQKNLQTDEFPQIIRISQTLRMNIKYIERKFQEEMGLTPKKFTEILKFNKLASTLIEKPKQSWSHVCHAAGFIDYSHLCKHTYKYAQSAPHHFKKSITHSHREGQCTHLTLGATQSLCLVPSLI